MQGQSICVVFHADGCLNGMHSGSSPQISYATVECENKVQPEHLADFVSFLHNVAV
jgi:hypothetical protein